MARRGRRPRGDSRTESPVAALAALSRTWGPDAARAKADLLQDLAQEPRLAVRELLDLQELLCFLRAYPDDARVLRGVLAVGSRLRRWGEGLPGGPTSPLLLDRGYPGSQNFHPFSFGVLRRMVRLFPGCLEIDWDEIEDDALLHHALVLLVTPGERQGLDDIELTWPEWLARCKPARFATDLEFIVHVFESADLPIEAKGHLFDGCGLPVRFDLALPGTGCFEVAWPRKRIAYQRRAIDRKRRPLAPIVRRPIPGVRLASEAKGRRLLDLSLAALGCRNLEILLLTYADPRDAWLIDCGRGLDVLLMGSLPGTRDPLSTSYFHLVFKNGVPIGYGPASVCLGTCEMGLNLFPAFRGGEIPWVYAQLMRCFYHVLGARYFTLTAYGMGAGNPEAIRSGAFWFYRKLGFRPLRDDLEELARSEEERMRGEPGYRSGYGVLKRFAESGVYLDLSGGSCTGVNHGRIGTQQTRFVEERFAGDRARARAACRRQAARALRIRDLGSWSEDERRALDTLAPIFALLPGVAEWSAVEKARAIRFVRAKGGRSEARTDRMLFAHAPFREGLRRLARAGDEG